MNSPPSTSPVDPALRLLVELTLEEVREMRRAVARLEERESYAIEAATIARATDVYVRTQIKPHLEKHGDDIREIRKHVGLARKPVRHAHAIAPPPPLEEDDDRTGDFPIPPDAQRVLDEAGALIKRERRRDSFMWRQRRLWLGGIAAGLVVAAVAGSVGYIVAHAGQPAQKEIAK